MRTKKGFTIVEIMVTVAIIATLAFIVTLSFNRQLIETRDSARATNATLFAAALEKYYENKGEYPSPRALLSTHAGNTGDAVATRLSIKDKSTLVMPNAPASTTNSVVAALGTDDVLTYVANSAAGTTSCQTDIAGGCDEFTLTYKKESDDSVVTIQSTHKGRPGDYQSPLEAPNQPTIAAVQSGTTVVATASVPACLQTGVTAKYSFQMKIGAGAWSAWTAWQVANTYTNSSPANATLYSFQVMVRCDVGTSTGDASTVGGPATVTYYAMPATPAAPTVTAGLSGANAQGVTGAVTCNYGTAQYQLEWRTNDGAWNIGWTWGSGLIANIGASDGVKYGFRSTARCVNSTQIATSAVSTEATYIDPIATPAGPTVPNTATAANRTFTWSSSGCPAGTWAIYQYNFLRWNYSWAWMSGTWTDTGTGTSAYNSANDWGVYYNIGVVQGCTNNYTTSSWSAATWGTYYVNPVGYSQLRGYGMRLDANTNLRLRLNNFANECDAYTVREIFIETSWDNAAFVIMSGVGWYSAADNQEIAISHAVASGSVAEVWPRTRCRNPATGMVASPSGLTSISRYFNTGNIYNRGSSKYNISCGWGSANQSFCAGGWNSTGSTQGSTSTSITWCYERTGGIENTAIRYTRLFALGANPSCWLSVP